MTRRARLALVTTEPKTVRKAPTLRRRRVTLVCQDCGTQHSYMYSGSGPYRAFCKACR